jgi:hypothetical protein
MRSPDEHQVLGGDYVFYHAPSGSEYVPRVLLFELELIQTHMAQKPMLRVDLEPGVIDFLTLSRRPAWVTS